jgi:hypothetical protein
MSDNNISTFNLIRDITLHYIEHFYNKYLKEHNIKVIPEPELRTLVSNLYNDKQAEIRSYIRSNLKDNLGSNYSSLIVENALSEMFADKEYAVNKVVFEILQHQIMLE